MQLSIQGLTEIRERLARLRTEDLLRAALEEQAERLAQAVREGLSEPQGGGDHDRPWLRTGALRDSVSATSEGLEAAIGSSNPAAAPQEMGTSRIPPRPFLAPVASELGGSIAEAIGGRLASALRGEEGVAAAPGGLSRA